MAKRIRLKTGIDLGGVPRKEVDFNLLDNLIAIFCTGEECAGVLEIDYDTLNRNIKEKFNIGFSEYFKQKNFKGRASLRRTQFNMAQTNPALAISLGKQYLGQKDTPLVDQTSHNHYVILRNTKAIAEQRTPAELPTR